MKIAIVRIEDNFCKINEVTKLEGVKQEVIKNISNKIDKLQEEGFLQILAYVKCAYEDYASIVGKRRYVDDGTGLHVNLLDVSNVSRSIRICAREDSVFIDFNYNGLPIEQPPRMRARFKDNNIIITDSTRQGICDLMNGWGDMKQKIQERIESVYKQKTAEIKSDISNLEHLLSVAEKFKA